MIYILHCHTDYYGPQLIGAYSTLESLNLATEAYAKVKPTWTKDDTDGLSFTAKHVDFVYYEVDLDSPVKEIK